VGRTRRSRRRTTECSDHPHTRGENERCHLRARRAVGPSPHAWGEPHHRRRFPVKKRTIPTRVGRTTMVQDPRALHTDHPHTRGENPMATVIAGSAFGPSPHAWGERDGDRGRDELLRTIPTRVGRTVADIAASPAPKDHPHTRGENERTWRRCEFNVGPSPHAWGEHDRAL